VNSFEFSSGSGPYLYNEICFEIDENAANFMGHKITFSEKSIILGIAVNKL
jgi:hypothetical protein